MIVQLMSNPNTELFISITNSDILDEKIKTDEKGYFYKEYNRAYFHTGGYHTIVCEYKGGAGYAPKKVSQTIVASYETKIFAEQRKKKLFLKMTTVNEKLEDVILKGGANVGYRKDGAEQGVYIQLDHETGEYLSQDLEYKKGDLIHCHFDSDFHLKKDERYAPSSLNFNLEIKKKGVFYI